MGKLMKVAAYGYPMDKTRKTFQELANIKKIYFDAMKGELIRTVGIYR